MLKLTAWAMSAPMESAVAEKLRIRCNLENLPHKSQLHCQNDNLVVQDLVVLQDLEVPVKDLDLADILPVPDHCNLAKDLEEVILLNKDSPLHLKGSHLRVAQDLEVHLREAKDLEVHHHQDLEALLLQDLEVPHNSRGLPHNNRDLPLNNLPHNGLHPNNPHPHLLPNPHPHQLKKSQSMMKSLPRVAVAVVEPITVFVAWVVMPLYITRMAKNKNKRKE